MFKKRIISLIFKYIVFKLCVSNSALLTKREAQRLLCTYGNDGDCSENIYKVWYRAFSNERPFYQLLYLIPLDPAVVVDSEDTGNTVLRNAKPLNDIATSLHQPLNNCIQLRHIRIYYQKTSLCFISFNLISRLVKIIKKIFNALARDKNHSHSYKHIYIII